MPSAGSSLGADHSGSTARRQSTLQRANAIESNKRRLSKAEKELMVEQATWDEWRLEAYLALRSQRCDLLITFLIVSNLLIMLVEANHRAKCYPAQCEDPTLVMMNRVMLVIYTIEAVIRGYVDRSKYFHDRWNCLDFSIVSFAWMDEIITALSSELPVSGLVPLLRIIRIARLMRAVRLLRFYPELYVMIRGFIGAMRAMFWGFVLIIMLLMCWSLVCVEIIHPISMDMADWLQQEGREDEIDLFCQQHYSTVFGAGVIFFQTLVAGDSWGQCTLPIINFAWWTFVIFALALVSVSLGFMNLILAVIVDHAAAARDGDKQEQAEEKEKEAQEMLGQWKEIMTHIDSDADGTITLDELVEGYENPDVQHTLQLMGVGKSDLESMFRLMDVDDSGDLDYEELMDVFAKAQSQEPRTYLMMTKLQCDSMARRLRKIDERLTGQAPYKPRLGGRSSSSVLCAAAAPPGRPSSAPSPAPAPAPAPALPSPHAPDAERVALASLDSDLRAMNLRLQEHFSDVQRRMELNIRTLTSRSQGPAATSEASSEKRQACPAWAQDWGSGAGLKRRPSPGADAASSADADPVELLYTM